MLRPITKEDYASGKPVYAVYMGYSKYLEHGIFYNTEYVAARNKIKVRFTINRDILKRQNWGCEFSPNKFFVEKELKRLLYILSKNEQKQTHIREGRSKES